ncbi:MAG: hypothetical protein ACFFCV_06095 [Promethearchaeota archaeon]
MRNKIIAIIIMLIGLSLLSIGLIQGQYNLINTLYERMILIP